MYTDQKKDVQPAAPQVTELCRFTLTEPLMRLGHLGLRHLCRNTELPMFSRSLQLDRDTLYLRSVSLCSRVNL